MKGRHLAFSHISYGELIATTQPTTTKQLKTTFVGVVLLSVKINHHHHTTTPPHHPGTDYNSGRSRQPLKLMFGIQPYLNKTRQHMEDDLNIFQNGRRPNVFFQLEDDLHILCNGKQP
jgi:hypothetical protein